MEMIVNGETKIVDIPEENKNGFSSFVKDIFKAKLKDFESFEYEDIDHVVNLSLTASIALHDACPDIFTQPASNRGGRDDSDSDSDSDMGDSFEYEIDEYEEEWDEEDDD
jgi:hypothetical protein